MSSQPTVTPEQIVAACEALGLDAAMVSRIHLTSRQAVVWQWNGAGEDRIVIPVRPAPRATS